MAKQTTGKGPGRPTKYRPDFHDNDMIERGRKGECLTEIAATWGVARQKLYEWMERHESFRESHLIYKTAIEAWYISFGRNVMVGRVPNANIGAYVWITKNVLKWSNNVEPERDTSSEFNLELL